MIWKTIIGYWRAALTLLLSLGSAALTFLAMQSRANRKEKKRLQAQVEHQQRVMQEDKEIELEHDKRLEELADELEGKRSSSELSDPHDW